MGLEQARLVAAPDAQLWKQERDAIAENKRLRRAIESEGKECRKQACTAWHTAAASLTDMSFSSVAHASTCWLVSPFLKPHSCCHLDSHLLR